MKNLLLSVVLGCAFCTTTFAEAGTLKTGAGKLFDEANFKVVKKPLKKGEAIKRHNHEGYDLVFTVTKGQIAVKLNDSEKHLVKVGDVLHFGGKDYIESEPVTEDTEFMATLVKEGK